jgi:hypothetical protein
MTINNRRTRETWPTIAATRIDINNRALGGLDDDVSSFLTFFFFFVAPTVDLSHGRVVHSSFQPRTHCTHWAVDAGQSDPSS